MPYSSNVPNSLVLGITGASGSPLALRLFTYLLPYPVTLNLVFTETGSQLFQMETGVKATKDKMIEFAEPRLKEIGESIKAKVNQYEPSNLFAPPASGSNLWEAMVICPASAGMCGRIASGSGEDLIARCADVSLKERRTLILVVRESPMSLILLKNLITLTEAGAIVIPPVITYYHEPKTLEDELTFWVGRILDKLGLTHHLLKRWGE